MFKDQNIRFFLIQLPDNLFRQSILPEGIDLFETVAEKGQQINCKAVPQEQQGITAFTDVGSCGGAKA